MTPGCTQAMRLLVSTDSTLFIRPVDTTTGRPSGIAPPASPVPAPRGTTAEPCCSAIPMIAWTSSVVSGKHTGPAMPPSNTEASCAASDRWAPSVRTRSASSAAVRSATSGSIGSRVERNNGIGVSLSDFGAATPRPE